MGVGIEKFELIRVRYAHLVLARYATVIRYRLEIAALPFELMTAVGAKVRHEHVG